MSAGPDEVVLAARSMGSLWPARSPVHRYGDQVYVDSPLGTVRSLAVPRFPDPDSAVEQGSLLAPDARDR